MNRISQLSGSKGVRTTSNRVASTNQGFPARGLRWLVVIAAVLSLFAMTVVFADGLQGLLARLHIVESSTPPPVDTFGSQRAEEAPMLTIPPPVEWTSGGTEPPPDLGSRQMSPEEAQTFFSFPLHYPSYVPEGMHLAYVESLPLTTQRAVVVLEEDAPSPQSSRKARISIFQRPIRSEDLESASRYSIPQGSGEAVQIADTEGLYVEAVWLGDPPHRDERFHQLIFQRDGMTYILYAPRDRVPLSELLRIAESLRLGPE